MTNPKPTRRLAALAAALSATLLLGACAPLVVGGVVLILITR